MPTPNPVLIKALRGNSVESIHRGSFVVVNARGEEKLSAGDIENPVFPRSGVKPIQALALIETGAAKRFGLGHANLALACGSHNGETTHTEIIENWLKKVQCGVDDLVCGPSLPWTQEGKKLLFENGKTGTSLHDNCSGKHTAFLSIAKHLGYPTLGYNRLDHPVQKLVIQILEEMTGLELFKAPMGIDGCGIPTIAIPLSKLALAMARLGDPHDQCKERQASCSRIRRAIAAEPYLFGGKNRFCTRVIDALGESALVKTGAEGIYCATLTKIGLGVAIKIDDGGRRGAEAVMMRLLIKLGVLTENAKGRLLNLLEPPIFSRSGEVVGLICADHQALR